MTIVFSKTFGRDFVKICVFIDMKLEHYGCLILAGGKSSRMGMNKALLEIDGKSFISILQCELSQFGEKYISANFEINDLNPGYVVIADYIHNIGPVSGILSALEASEKEALFVVACDMPFVTIELARKLFKVWEKNKSNILVVSDNSGKVHPLCGIYSRKNIFSIRKAVEEGNYRMMDIISCSDSEIIQLSSIGFSDTIVVNINTPEDYMNLQEVLHHKI